MTWTLLQRKHEAPVGKNCPKELKITIHAMSTFTYLKKSSRRGVSICIGFNDYLSLLIERNLTKAKSAM
jgi:hypothetical protein